MGDSLARVITIGSIVLTVASLGLAVLFARKATRIRLRFDVARAVVGVGAILAMAAITHVATPLVAVVAAIAVGLGLGFAQGSTIDVTGNERGLFATRSPVGLVLWGVGIIMMQAAGIASRAGVVKIGQTIAWFSVCLGIGLLVGRNGPMREARSSLAGAGTAAALSVVVVPVLALAGVLAHPAAAGDVRLTDDEVCALIVPSTSDLIAVIDLVPAQESVFPAGHWVEWEPLAPVTGSTAACRQTGYDTYTAVGDIALTVYLFGSEAEARAQYDAEVAANDAWHAPLWAEALEQLATYDELFQVKYGTGPLDDYGITGRYWIDWGHPDHGDQRLVGITGPFMLFSAVSDDLAFEMGPTREDRSHLPDRYLIETMITPMADTVRNIEAFLATAAPADDAPDTPVADDAPDTPVDDVAPAGDAPDTPVDDVAPADDAPDTPVDDVAPADDAPDTPVEDVAGADDAEEPIEPTEAATQAVAGLVAAVAIGMITWAEAAGEIARILGGGRGGAAAAGSIGEILDRAGDGAGSADDTVAETPPDPNEIVSAWDPTVDNGPDEPPGGWVRVTRAERERLEGLDRARRGEQTAARHATERAERQAEIDAHHDRMAEIDEEHRRATIDDLRREQLERERLINEAEQDFWNNPVNRVISIFIDASSGIGRDLADTPRVAGQIIHDAIAKVHEEVTDEENWTILGETIHGTVGDAVRLTAFDDEAWDHLVEGTDAIGSGAGMIASAVAEDPVGFVETVLAVDKLRDSMDPNASLEERLSDYGRFATEAVITWATAGGGKAVDVATDAARVVDAATDARAAARILDGATDARSAGRVLDGATDARSAGRVLDGATDAGIAARATENVGDLTDAQRAAARMDGAPPRIGDDAFRTRQQAWADAQQAASRNVDEFERALDDLAAARRGGDPAEIAAAQQRAKDSMIRIQADKRGLQEINLRDPSTRGAYNDLLRDELYDPVDRAVLDQIAADAGFGKMGAQPRMILEDGTRVYVDDAGNAVRLMEPTNPSATVKVGADRDFTVAIQPKGQAAADVHHDVVASIYNRELHRQVGDPARLGLPDDPAALAGRLDQAMTSRFHTESYTDLETIFRDPSGALRDPQQIRMTMENKGIHWMNQFDDVPDARLAENIMAEGMRQLSKQFGNQVTSRFDAMNALRADAGLDALRMPDRLQESYRILSQVNPKPPAVPTLSPVEAERLLHQMGTSPSKFADEMGSFMQMVEQSRVQLP